MKIYVSEKDFNNLDTLEDVILQTLENTEVIATDINGDDFDIVEDIPAGTYIISLEQHEAEIRKQERQKVIAELEEWANTCYLVESIYEGIYCIDKDDLKQKLNEMKEC